MDIGTTDYSNSIFTNTIKDSKTQPPNKNKINHNLTASNLGQLNTVGLGNMSSSSNLQNSTNTGKGKGLYQSNSIMSSASNASTVDADSRYTEDGQEIIVNTQSGTTTCKCVNNDAALGSISEDEDRGGGRKSKRRGTKKKKSKRRRTKRRKTKRSKKSRKSRRSRRR